MNLPVAGGGYFRLLPYSITAWAIHHINEISLSQQCSISTLGRSTLINRESQPPGVLGSVIIKICIRQRQN
jgi:hypothetical protein